MSHQPMAFIRGGNMAGALIAWLLQRGLQMLTRRGVLVEDMGQTYLVEPYADGEEARKLRPLQAAAIAYRMASAPAPGRRC